MAETESTKEEWITSEERDLVRKLRETKTIANELPLSFFSKSEEDQVVYLVRWIRARDGNLQKATEMLLNHLKWRKDNEIHKIFEIPGDTIVIESCPWNCFGSDTQGRPLIVSSGWDLEKVVHHNKQGEFETHVRQIFENYLKEMEKRSNNRKPGSPPITQYWLIYDFKGFSYSQMLNISVVKKMLDISAMYEAHYPEILYRLVFLNSPWFYPMILNIAKVFSPARTLEKIYSYTNMDAWRKDVEKYMDPSSLPVQFGGTNEDLLPPSDHYRIVRLKTKNNFII